MSRFALILASLLLSASVAAATPAYTDLEDRLSAEQLRATGLDTLTPEQLALLNGLLRDEAKAAAVQAPAPTTTASAPRDRIGMDAEPIRSRVVGTVSGWEPGTVFVLENGQRWTVLKGSMKLRKPLSAPEIVVVPGLVGRWFLQVDEDLPKARVYRED